MRKLQQVMLVAAAAGSLSAIGAGAGTAYAHDGAKARANDVFRPYQECSPQTFAAANFPFGVLAVPETEGFACGQFNHAFAKKR
ncbi:hypothetical protein [Streptomyces sp. YGL11-2]|uniref:hypothetical protein n=1 Tax=Streptomyces sp. YGL11-2 TaxID=3414028 RepID=UPI003CF7FCBD